MGNGSQEYTIPHPRLRGCRKKHKSLEPRRTRRPQRKRQALLCALRALRGSLLFRAFCDTLLLCCRKSRIPPPVVILAKVEIHLAVDSIFHRNDRERIVGGLSPFQRPRRIDNNTPFHQTGTESTDNDGFSRCFTI